MSHQEMLDGMSDDELRAAAKEANEDCIEAGNTQRNSEWHEACFAACVVFSQEMTKRGINIRGLVH